MSQDDFRELAPSEYAVVDDAQESRFYVLVNEAQATDIAAGFVPNAVQAQVRAMLDWASEDQRRAARPVPKKRKSA
jgi:hypothetical protein